MKKKYFFQILFLSIFSFTCSHLKEAYRSYAKMDYQKTIFLCQKAIQSDSADVDAYFLLGKSYHAVDSLKQALELTKRAHELKPESSNILKELVQIHRDMAKQDQLHEEPLKALKHYTSAEDLSPKNLEVLQEIADLYYQLGYLDDAQLKYENLIQFSSNTVHNSEQLSKIQERTKKAHHLFNQGLSAEKNEKYLTAKSLFNQALKEKSDLTDAQYHLFMTEGRLLLKNTSKNDLWNAIDFFGKATSLHSNAVEPYFFMAQAYEKKDPNEFLNAIDAYETALRMDPTGSFAKICKQKIEDLKKRKNKLDAFWGRKN